MSSVKRSNQIFSSGSGITGSFPSSDEAKEQSRKRLADINSSDEWGHFALAIKLSGL